MRAHLSRTWGAWVFALCIVALPFGVWAASNYPAATFSQVLAGLTSGGNGILPVKIVADSDGVTGHVVVDAGTGFGNTPAITPCVLTTTTATVCKASSGAFLGISNRAPNGQTLTVTCYDNATTTAGTVVIAAGPSWTNNQGYAEPFGGIRLANGLTCVSSAAPTGGAMYVLYY